MSVVWHDVECGSYTADLPLWRELAATEAGPVLDVGAGTGRVALDLARVGHAVTALDLDPELLGALGERARREGLDVATVTADAAGFDLGDTLFGLILVPMQTLQLLADASARAGLFATARRHLAPGGLLAAAILEALEAFEAEPAALPLPDVAEHAGWRYLSHPVAVRVGVHAVRLERIRQTIAPDGTRSAEGDVIELAHVSAGPLEAEAAASGLTPETRRHVAETEAHVGATVVMLRG